MASGSCWLLGNSVFESRWPTRLHRRRETRVGSWLAPDRYPGAACDSYAVAGPTGPSQAMIQRLPSRHPAGSADACSDAKRPGVQHHTTLWTQSMGRRHRAFTLPAPWKPASRPPSGRFGLPLPLYRASRCRPTRRLRRGWRWRCSRPSLSMTESIQVSLYLLPVPGHASTHSPRL